MFNWTAACVWVWVCVLDVGYGSRFVMTLDSIVLSLILFVGTTICMKEATQVFSFITDCAMSVIGGASC